MTIFLMFRILSTADKKIIQPPKKTVAVKQKAQDFRGTDKKIGGGEREDGTASREKEEKKEIETETDHEDINEMKKNKKQINKNLDNGL